MAPNRRKTMAPNRRRLTPAQEILADGVLQMLIEMFPQVNSLVLKSVARDDFNDANAAAEYVANEVIPYIEAQSQPQPQPLFATGSSNSESPFEGRAGKLESSTFSADSILGLPKLLSEAGPSSINAILPVATQDVNTGFTGHSISPTIIEPVVLEPLDKFLYHDANVADVANDDEPIVLIRKRRSYDNDIQEHVENVESLVESKVIDSEVSASTHDEVTHQLDVSEFEGEDNYIHLDVDTLKLIDSTNKESDLSYSSKSASEKDAFTIEDVNMENESTMVNKYEKCNVELLDESIEDARDKKKIITLSMNSVVDLMREVEQNEKVAEQIKEQSNCDCSDIFSKVDEIKETLQRAKEANDMHAGEVYAERAILATEYKELQHRLFTFSEKNKSLEILVEMQKALEIRLATALEQIALAKEEKVNKEMAAREELSFQQHKMEEVVEESKKLMLEVEENSRLQEIIMDRGHIVDILLGEYAVIDQDVLLLKEKFEKRIPLSRSHSSNQTSSALSSTNSSFRSTATVTPLEAEFESPKKGIELDDSYGFLDNSSRSEVAESPTSPINNGDFYASREEKLDNSSRSAESPTSEKLNNSLRSEVVESPKSPVNTGAYFLSGKEKEKRIADRKKLLEDGWELFENGDLLAC